MRSNTEVEHIKVKLKQLQLPQMQSKSFLFFNVRKKKERDIVRGRVQS